MNFIHTLVIGGGNAAADVVAALSRAKRNADDETPVYWSNRMEHFEINTDVARDLNEEILLGGHIRILQGALPRIGGAVSPAYIEIQQEGSFKERKNTNLIYTAVKDAVRAVDHIATRLSAKCRRMIDDHGLHLLRKSKMLELILSGCSMIMA